MLWPVSLTRYMEFAKKKKQVNELKEGLQGQMADGWGEGLRQNFEEYGHVLEIDWTSLKFVE